LYNYTLSLNLNENANKSDKFGEIFKHVQTYNYSNKRFGSETFNWTKLKQSIHNDDNIELSSECLLNLNYFELEHSLN